MSEKTDGKVSFEQLEERDAIREMCEQLAKDQRVDGDERMRQFGKLCTDLVPRLLDALDAAERTSAGKLGEDLRQAVRDHFLAKFEGRSLLAHRVTVSRVGLWFGEQGRATADVRLELIQ